MAAKHLAKSSSADQSAVNRVPCARFRKEVGFGGLVYLLYKRTALGVILPISLYPAPVKRESVCSSK